MKRVIPGICAVALVLLLASGAAAQQTTMTGEVRTKDGEPFPGVTVLIKSVEFGQ